MTWLRLLIGVTVSFALLLAAGACALKWALSPIDIDAEEVVFTVAHGSSLRSIARDLEATGLVRSAGAVEWVARYRGLGSSLRAGEYRLSAALGSGEILDRIASGDVVTYEVVVPEGFTAAMIAARLEAAGLIDAQSFLDWVHNPESAAAHGVEGVTLEGYLFPETYRLPRGLTPRETAAVMVDQFLEVWRKIEPLARERDLSMREVVTLASLVEKETAVPEERPLIASVFLNRLRRGMRLETDPSVIYGMADFSGNLRRSDLENPDNSYNTYRIAGLPPGPIASPGENALRAVVSPAATDYLYFVSRNDGTHHFSSTYREHVLAVNRFQRHGSR